MKYNLERMLKEIEQDKQRRRTPPQDKLTQEQIRKLIRKRKDQPR